MYNARYYTLRQNFMDKHSKILSKLYKDLVQQMVHKKVQQKCNKNYKKKCTVTMMHIDKAFCNDIHYWILHFRIYEFLLSRGFISHQVYSKINRMLI